MEDLRVQRFRARHDPAASSTSSPIAQTPGPWVM